MVRKTFSIQTLPDAEAKQLFENAKKMYKCNLKGVDVNEARTITLKISTQNPDRNKDGGFDYKSWELLEYSLVLVPDNPDALTIMRSKGFDPDKILAEQKKFEEAKDAPKEEKPGEKAKEKPTEAKATETPKTEEKK